MISGTVKFFGKVVIGQNVTIEDYSIVGAGALENDEQQTVIGDNAYIRSHTVIYSGTVIGRNFQTGNKVNIRERCIIGDNVSIGTFSDIEHHCTIGHKSRLHTNVFIPEYTVIEDEVWVGPHVVLTNSRYPNSKHSKKNISAPILHKGCIVGGHVTIMPGVCIARNCLVGAAAVVTKDTIEGGVYVGSPAQFIKNISEIKDYNLDPSL